MDAVIGDPPLSIDERGDRQSEFEFQSIFGMKVSPTVAAHDFKLAVDRFDDIGRGERFAHVFGYLRKAR